jgi:hypothetical protein
LLIPILVAVSVRKASVTATHIAREKLVKLISGSLQFGFVSVGLAIARVFKNVQVL